MGYVRITIHQQGGGKRSGIRSFSERMKLDETRAHALHLAAKSLGRPVEIL